MPARVQEGKAFVRLGSRPAQQRLQNLYPSEQRSLLLKAEWECQIPRLASPKLKFVPVEESRVSMGLFVSDHWEAVGHVPATHSNRRLSSYWTSELAVVCLWNTWLIDSAHSPLFF